MNTLLARSIATMTEMRDPQRVMDTAGGKPVAILKNSKLVAYLVPAALVHAEPHGGIADNVVATRDEVMASIAKRRSVNQPVLDLLRDR